MGRGSADPEHGMNSPGVQIASIQCDGTLIQHYRLLPVSDARMRIEYCVHLDILTHVQ